MDDEEGRVWVKWFEGEQDTGIVRFLFHAHFNYVESQTCGGNTFTHAFSQYHPLTYTEKTK